MTSASPSSSTAPLLPAHGTPLNNISTTRITTGEDDGILDPCVGDQMTLGPVPGKDSDGQQDYPFTLLETLAEFRDMLNQKHVVAAEHGALVFESPPSITSIPLAFQPHHVGKREVNRGQFALAYHHVANSALLEHEDWLLDSYLRIEQYQEYSCAHINSQFSDLLRDFARALDDLEKWKRTEWERQRLQAATGGTAHITVQTIPTDDWAVPAIAQFNPILVVCYLLVAVLHLLCRVSIKRCTFVLGSIRLMLQIALCDDTSKMHDSLISDIPTDVRTLLHRLNVMPITRSFACCTDCFALYPLDSPNNYPDRCTARRAPLSPPCDAQLRTRRNINGVLTAFPVRKFVYQDFKHWLGHLLCRKGMEEILDKGPLALQKDTPEYCGDIFDTQTIRDLKDADGQPFFCATTNEGRYAFSLCMDGLQAHGRGGPPDSVGAIYLACLNLPPNIRYNVDNLFLAGIIPGPTHPSMAEINPLLTPLIDDFTDLWNDGVHYSATPCHTEGKTCKCVIIPLVCDILAARQMAGFTAHNHALFCSFCRLKIDEIENLEWWNWTARTCDQHRLDAERWKHAGTETERAQIYEKTGVRWSELLRLPYWDPIKFTALDPMHALFLNALGTHVEKIWGLSSDVNGDLRGITYDVSKKVPSVDEMQSAYVVLRAGTNSALGDLRVEVLRQLCKEHDLRFSGNKNRLQERLCALRIQRQWVNHGGEPIFHGLQHHSSEELQEQIEEASDALQTKSTSYLAQFKRSVLQHICVAKLGGEFEQYVTLTRDELMKRLKDYRVSQGITDHDGRLLKRRTGTGKQSVIDAKVLQRGMKALEKGTKTDLAKLPASVLMEIHAQMLGERDVKLTKAKLLERLLEYRDINGLGRSAVQQAQQLSQAHSILNISRTTGVVRATTGSSSQSFMTVGGEDISQAELANAEYVLDRGNRKKLERLGTTALRALCILRLHRADAEEMERNQTMSALHQYRIEHGITHDDGTLMLDRLPPGRKNRILGKDILEVIWNDMDNLILPSWVSRVSQRIGGSTRASGLGLGADEWRTFCTINLVTTLVYLWGSSPVGSRQYNLLVNFMDLVGAVKLASMRIVTPPRLNRCRDYFHRYLTSLLDLFPGATIRPNQHMLLHLPDILETLGPAQAIWCFGFERANYTLQQTNSNNRIADISVTYLTRFCCRQALRNLFTSITLPTAVRSLIPTFLQSFQSDHRGTLLGELAAFDSMESLSTETKDSGARKKGEGNLVLLPDNIIVLLREWLALQSAGTSSDCVEMDINPYVRALDRIELRGVLCKASDGNSGDSNVVFAPGDGDTWRAGRIISMFRYEPMRAESNFRETFLVIKEYSPLVPSHANLDPYRKFPVAGGRLFYRRFLDGVQLLTCLDVVSHFASLPRLLPGTTVDCVHILPLDKW